MLVGLRCARPHPTLPDLPAMPLRIAIIGCGRLGTFHAQKLAKMPDVQIVGVVDPLPAGQTVLPPNCIRPPWIRMLPWSARSMPR